MCPAWNLNKPGSKHCWVLGVRVRVQGKWLQFAARAALSYCWNAVLELGPQFQQQQQLLSGLWLWWSVVMDVCIAEQSNTSSWYAIMVCCTLHSNLLSNYNCSEMPGSCSRLKNTWKTYELQLLQDYIYNLRLASEVFQLLLHMKSL